MIKLCYEVSGSLLRNTLRSSAEEGTQQDNDQYNKDIQVRCAWLIVRLQLRAGALVLQRYGSQQSLKCAAAQQRWIVKY